MGDRLWSWRHSTTLLVKAIAAIGNPILELAKTIYQVTGDVDFVPIPDRAYVIKGILGEKYSAVWIEDSETGETVGRKVEVDGSAKLSIFEK